ncbi:hypothetical protein JHD49_06210 [Sulfurimonas sp. SAG-AH-194-C21]|nr:hypothetical protein [Sulfurimonas sp. SAG-AH-194-C21]MDF1883530.1 hypothetical protein [Sulfurimonas sp. SAG-AH-194-C21]
MQQAYRYAVLYFLAFSLLLLVSSLLLFDDKIGLSVHGVLEYYLGNEDKFLVEKSWGTILKIILPHIFAFGLFFMVVLHFLLFTKHRTTQLFIKLTYAIFIMGFLELFSPYFIIMGLEFFAYVKLVSFISLELLLLYTLWLLLSSIYQH